MASTASVATYVNQAKVRVSKHELSGRMDVVAHIIEVVVTVTVYNFLACSSFCREEGEMKEKTSGSYDLEKQ